MSTPPPLTILLLLRDAEHEVAEMVRLASSLPTGQDGQHDRVDLIALDQRSVDNTLSVLSVLARRYPSLRIVHDVWPGHAWTRGIDLAAGEVLVAIDHHVDADDLTWCLESVRRGGTLAAMIPGVALAVHRSVAQRCRVAPAGLVGAQRAVSRHLDTSSHRHALAQRRPSHQSVRDRARLFVRERLTRLGLGALDRPRRRP